MDEPDIVVTDTGQAWNYATNKEVQGTYYKQVAAPTSVLSERIRLLEEALEPFLTHKSSDECITVQLRNEWITRGRALLAPKEVPDA